MVQNRISGSNCYLFLSFLSAAIWCLVSSTSCLVSPISLLNRHEYQMILFFLCYFEYISNTVLYFTDILKKVIVNCTRVNILEWVLCECLCITLHILPLSGGHNVNVLMRKDLFMVESLLVSDTMGFNVILKLVMSPP